MKNDEICEVYTRREMEGIIKYSKSNFRHGENLPGPFFDEKFTDSLMEFFDIATPEKYFIKTITEYREKGRFPDPILTDSFLDKLLDYLSRS